ncbi:ribonuclease III [Actinomadura sp. KC345]|uniref:ribonuclease III family protein n=1 Tax=Actinomadura sp. KC345 TaxID=2530371 RepID=UPI0010436337|nr:ribonuclease III domain-containing protein [Actinomadura sp. KC345]TDC51936.1 ribonuclease III [Actinomadura sp. KC345]
MSVNRPERFASTERAELARALGIEPGALLEQALTHRSYAREHGVAANGTLVSLGGAALSMGVAEFLYRGFPDLEEDLLSRMRGAVVSAQVRAEVARSLKVGDHIRLGNGEWMSGGQDKDSVLAEAMLGLIGAVYRQGGMEKVSSLVHRYFGVHIEQSSARRGVAVDWKTELQLLVSREKLDGPRYRFEEYGAGHQRRYSAWVVVGGSEYGPGEGGSKKQAEQHAAEAAWRALDSGFSGGAEPAAGG